MKHRLLSILKWGLLIWGGFSLAAVLTLGGFLAYQFTGGNRTRDDSATRRDVRHVLNWCQLGEDRIEEVVHSHVSSRSFTGDYLDAFAIRISHVSVEDLTQRPRGGREHWYRGDQLPKVVDDAVQYAASSRHEVSWFPPPAELRSPEFFVYLWSVHYHGITPSAAEVIFVRPADRMVFFLGTKT